MPDRGLLEPSSIAEVAFGAPAGLAIANARWLQVTFEVERQAALESMPCDVGRPIPPYGRLLVASSPSGSLAVLSVGGRYRMLPRNITVATIAQGVPAAARFGHGTSEGTISLHRDGQAVTAAISGQDGPIATVSLSSLYAIEPSMLRWDAFVALARADGNVVIAEVTPAHELDSAFLSKNVDITVDPAQPRTGPWRRLRSLGVISACYAEGSLSFSEPSVQQTWS